jgi:hypothetical protein
VVSRTRRYAAPIALAAALSLAAGALFAYRFIEQLVSTEIPVPPAPVGRLDSLFWDTTSVALTITADWQKVPMIVPAHYLESSSWYWIRMHFDDWDRVPSGVRSVAVANMRRRYAHVLENPRQWDRMEADDWDLVPQPLRAMAFIQMIRYWSGYYRVGSAFDLPRGTVTNTMGAIMMVESWFEHRAVSTSRSGNRDVGLGQMSDWTRERLGSLFETGRIDFAPVNDAGYFNPWQATRMVAIWFDLMLDEHRGDLDSAIRAYHRGSPEARAGAGEDYLTNVLNKRRTFMRGESRSATWNNLTNGTAGYR